MMPQINADQGFKRRNKVFVDTPLLHFIEEELLATSPVSEAAFYEVLTILIEEFGSQFRKNKGLITSPALLDEFKCEVPLSILDTLISVIERPEIHIFTEKNNLLKPVLNRISQLLPLAEMQTSARKIDKKTYYQTVKVA